MKSSDIVVKNALDYVSKRNSQTVSNASVGDMVMYAGAIHKVVKDLGSGKYILRSKTTGRTIGITAPGGLQVIDGECVNSCRK